MGGDKISQFVGQKYLSLESYRQNGQAVRTPVWFAEGDGRFYIYTLADSYKVKRIRHNPRVRIAPCDVLGNVKGRWVDATARFLDEAGDRRTHELLNRKYGLIKSLFDLFRIRKNQRLSIAIQLD
ncbi:MAG: PPOX class F420-dependent oxidoreductase [Acidobacteria bacterium]|nr:PPOX class F420-dependent oxidoreductase [Acidobacteriota bacterium]